jgi:hypothetical protein
LLRIGSLIVNLWGTVTLLFFLDHTIGEQVHLVLLIKKLRDEEVLLELRYYCFALFYF